MDEDSILPYQASPSLTVKQAVMYILGYRGEFGFQADEDWMEFDLSDYLHNLQDEADCALSEANYELEMLKREDDAAPEGIQIAKQAVAIKKDELERVQKLPDTAEEYRLLISH